MSIKKAMNGSTGSCSPAAERLSEALGRADAVLIGAGAGLSAAAGLSYDGERFERYFSDFRKAYGITDMYSGGFYPYATPEEYWAWWSRHIMVNRYAPDVPGLYSSLLQLVRDKEYFILTTNVDHQFQRAGFAKSRLFYTQGDYGLWQCSAACHARTYDNEDTVRRMFLEQKQRRVPTELLPRCPVCGAPMAMNLRCDDTFVQDAGWYAARAGYGAFLKRHGGGRVLFLELGVGFHTPVIIKYPFWQMTAQNPKAVYACVNAGEAVCPPELEKQSLCLNADIGTVVDGLLAANP